LESNISLTNAPNLSKTGASFSQKILTPHSCTNYSSATLTETLTESSLSHFEAGNLTKFYDSDDSEASALTPAQIFHELYKKFETPETVGDIDLVMKKPSSMVKREVDADGNEIFTEEIEQVSQSSQSTRHSNKYRFSQAAVGDYYENPPKM